MFAFLADKFNILIEKGGDEVNSIRVNSGRVAAEFRLPRAVESALPYRLSDEIRRSGLAERIEEIRMRRGRRCSLVVSGENVMLDTVMSQSDIQAVLEGICQGSLYAFSDTINQGYVVLPEGVRVGVCGRAGCEGDRVIGVYEIGSLSVRIPHATRPVGDEICSLIESFDRVNGVLIYSPPGVGKTTLLRGVASKLASGNWTSQSAKNEGNGGDNKWRSGGFGHDVLAVNKPLRTVVVDTRGELGFDVGGESLCLDVLSGYPRGVGVSIATRTLSAQLIVCDEIGDLAEARELLSAQSAGVALLASAHAASLSELLARPAIRLLHDAGMFGAYVGITRRAGEFDFDYSITMREDVDVGH